MLGPLTRLIYYTELLIPVLLLVPDKKKYCRASGLLLIILLHIGIAMSLRVGLFPLISISSALGLFPGGWMDKIGRLLPLSLHSPVSETAPNAGLRRWLLNGSSLVIAFYCLLINLSAMPWFPYQPSAVLNPVSNGLRLNQYWGMFSPGILKEEGWLVYHGRDSIGRQWDLKTNSDYVDYSKPAHLANTFKSDRWRKLFENMQRNDFIFLRHLYSGYVLKKWNREHPEKKLATLSLYFMKVTNGASYKKGPPQKILYALSATQ